MGVDLEKFLLLASTCVLALSVASLVLPMSQVWLGGAGILLAALMVTFGIRRRQKLDGTNATLLAAILVLGFIVLTLLSPTPRLQLAGGATLLAASLLLLGLRMNQALRPAPMTNSLAASEEGSDSRIIVEFKELILLAATGVLAICVASYVLPMCWVWSGGAGILLVALMTALGVRMRYGLDEANMALLAACAALVFFIVYLLLPTPRVQLTAGAALLAAFLLLLGLRVGQANGAASLSKVDGHISPQPALPSSPSPTTPGTDRFWIASKLNELDLLLLMPIGVLAVLVVALVMPTLYTGMGRTVFLWVAFGSLLGARVMLMKVRKWDEVNLVLMAQIAVLTPDLAFRMVPYYWIPWGKAGILLAGATLFLWLRGKHTANTRSARSDQRMLRWVVYGIVLAVVLGFLFPITSWWPA